MNLICQKISTIFLCHTCSSLPQLDKRPCNLIHTISWQIHDTQPSNFHMPKHKESGLENKFSLTSLMVERIGWAAYLEQRQKMSIAENYLSTPCSRQCSRKSSGAAHVAARHASAAAQDCWKRIRTTARCPCRTKQSVRRWLYRVYESVTFSKNANPPDIVLSRTERGYNKFSLRRPRLCAKIKT
jgi:hypothetical protein